MNLDTRARILVYIAAHNTGSLATERDGMPWATSLFYANDDFTLYFLAEPKTRHVQNVAQNRRVAVTISEDYPHWRLIQGVQIEGHCEEITHPIELVKAGSIYNAKFPCMGELRHVPKELGAAMAKVRLHKITPTWVRFIDNTRGLGFKDEIRF
jgi:hypothetical protein